MSDKSIIRMILEFLRDYPQFVMLYGLFIFIVIANILIIFFGRSDLQEITHSAWCYFVGGIVGMSIFRRTYD